MTFNIGVGGPGGFDMNGTGMAAASKAASTTLLGKTELVSPAQISPSEIFNITPGAMPSNHSVSPSQQQVRVTPSRYQPRVAHASSPRQI